MVEIPKGPTITCGFTENPVAVIATYKGGLVPVAGANVTLYLGALFPGLPMPRIDLTTDILGLAQTCKTKGQYVEAWIQKSNVDFGSGVGATHKIGSAAGVAWEPAPIVFTIQALSLPPGVVPPPVAPPVVIPPPVIPKPPVVCKTWDTLADIRVPSVLQAPFKIEIKDAFWLCREIGEMQEVTVPAEVIIAGQRFTIPLR